jgi:hypothetical protein
MTSTLKPSSLSQIVWYGRPSTFTKAYSLFPRDPCVRRGVDITNTDFAVIWVYVGAPACIDRAKAPHKRDS